MSQKTTVEETKAELASKDAQVTITLTHDEASQLLGVTEETPALLGHAEAVFALLWSGFVGGHLDGHAGVISLLELCSRGFRHATFTEGQAIERFDRKLRDAVAVANKAQIARETSKGEDQ